MTVTGGALYPFVPSGPDFRLAMNFFAALGFTPKWESAGYAGLQFGAAFFILQEYVSREWAENQMVVYEVSDLEAYYAQLLALDLPVKFAGVRVNPPKDFPWGREIHLTDPAGVCWHVRQMA